MKLYREVKASDRSPESDCIRFVIDENGARFADRFVQGKWYSDPIHLIKYWLEPTEITEEEIQEYLNKCEEAYGRPASLAVEFGISWTMDKLNQQK